MTDNMKEKGPIILIKIYACIWIGN